MVITRRSGKHAVVNGVLPWALSHDPPQVAKVEVLEGHSR